MSLRWLTIILLFLEKLLCQVDPRWGVKSPFQLQPKFGYQIKGQALILGLQDVHPDVHAAIPLLDSESSHLEDAPGGRCWTCLLSVCSPATRCTPTAPRRDAATISFDCWDGLFVMKCSVWCGPKSSFCLTADLWVLHTSPLSLSSPLLSSENQPEAPISLRVAMGVLVGFFLEP